MLRVFEKTTAAYHPMGGYRIEGRRKTIFVEAGRWGRKESDSGNDSDGQTRVGRHVYLD